jgi:hypothetical protein
MCVTLVFSAYYGAQVGLSTETATKIFLERSKNYIKKWARNTLIAKHLVDRASAGTTDAERP